MASTGYSTNSDQAMKAWVMTQQREIEKGTFYSKFQGGPDSLVYTKEDLSKKGGDKLSFGLTMRLTGEGKVSGETMAGNEEPLINFQATTVLENYRNAVLIDNKLSDQRVAFSIPEEAINRLKTWSMEKFDALCTQKLVDNQTKWFYGGTASSTATLTSGDKLTPSLINKIKYWSITGGSRSYCPLVPFSIEGSKYLVLLVPTDVAYDLSIDSNFTQYHRDLDARNGDSLIFKGGLGLISGVVIQPCEFLDSYNQVNGGFGNDVSYGRCILMGAGALNVAKGSPMEIIQDTKDYGAKRGYCVDSTYGVNAPVFNGKSYGSVGICVARSTVSNL